MTCDDCRQRIVSTIAGMACACRHIDRPTIQQIHAAYDLIPDGWPILDLFDAIDLFLSPPQGES